MPGMSTPPTFLRPHLLRLAACMVLLALTACGNKGPLTLSPRPVAEPAPAIEVDTTGAGGAAADADVPSAQDDAEVPPAPPVDDDPR